MGISSNTYNILASLFKHIFDENEFAPRGYTLIKGAYLQWRRGRGARGGPWLPLLLRPVGKLSMLSEIVGKLSMLSEIVGTLSMLSEIVKVVDGRGRGGGEEGGEGRGGVAEDLKCCPENFLVCRKKIFGLSEKYCPCPTHQKYPQKNMGPTAPLLT